MPGERMMIVLNGTEIIGLFGSTRQIHREIRCAKTCSLRTAERRINKDGYWYVGTCVFWGVLYESIEVRAYLVNLPVSSEMRMGFRKLSDRHIGKGKILMR